ncbi:dimer_Tnp_hAT domain-containing protein [Trichonephila clavipes]|nr:dimer_Tnp_hAT domain-containing protein [Trichonephila clavipes]
MKSTVKFYEWKEGRNDPEKKTLFRRKQRESCVNLTSELILLASCAHADKTKSDDKKRVRRRNVNFDYEARGDPIDDPTLKYKAEFYFFITLERERDKAINVFESRYKSSGPGRRDSSGFVALLNKKESPIEVLRFRSNLHFAPSLGIVLRILLTLPISVASGERSFSKLKLIKKFLRSTTTEDRLNGLTTIAIEHELAEEINVKEIIKENLRFKIFYYCKEQLPAPGNRSNERRDREKDLATTEEKKVGTEKREGEEKAGVVKSRHGWTMYGNPVTSEYILDFKKCPIEVYLQVDDHVHPGNCPAAVSSEKKQDLLHMEFYHHLPSWDMNEQMSYFSSFSDEWSRDLKSVQVLKQLSCRGDKVSNLLVNLGEEELKDYESLKQVVLKEYEPSPKICLENFSKAKRNSDETFSQFASRLTSMWLYYCKLRGANDFESVNQLIVADKMFEMLDSETATHIGKSYDEPEEAKWNDSEKRSFNGSWGKQPFWGEKSDNFSSRKNFDKGQVTEIKKFACFTCGSDKHFKQDCPKKQKEVDNKRLNENKVSTEGTELVDGTVAAELIC